MLLRCLIKRISFKPLLEFRSYFYDWKTCNETIFAPATAISSAKGSPLGIIRLSGHKSGSIIEDVTKLKLTRSNILEQYDKSRELIEPRKAKLTKLFDPVDNELIDIGIVLWFPKPNSYTGEDVVEFHVHGSQAILNKFLTTFGKIDGLRPAEPGEFTFRAYKNNKMTLMQAESLSELISSQTDHQRRLALKGLTGSTRKKYEDWIGSLVKILAHLEASIDFGEDELIGERQVVENCIQILKYLSDEVNRFILVESQCRDFIKTGARVAILGKPNAGKSTIMNFLCRREKSIISDLSGTTRDVVEHSFELGGHNITLSDTAGLRDPKNLFLFTSQDEEMEKKVDGIGQTPLLQNNLIEQHDKIEREGITRALKAAQDAHLILYLYDASQALDAHAIIDEITLVLSNFTSGCNSNNIRALHLVINKIDLNEKLKHTMANCDVVHNDFDGLRAKLKSRLDPICALDSIDITLVSCKTQLNLNVFIEKVSSSLDRLLLSNLRKDYSDTRNHRKRSDNLSPDRNQNGQIDYEYLNDRHLSLLRSVQRHLNHACVLDLRTIDEMAQHVRESVDYLSRIIGSITNEQVLDIIFRDFCIGK